MMKVKKSGRAKSLNSKLAAYSATATAALLAAPVAQATIQNITDLDVTLSFSARGASKHLNFTAGPLHGSFWNTHNGNKSYYLNLHANVAALHHVASRTVSRLNLNQLINGRHFYDGSKQHVAGFKPLDNLGQRDEFTPTHQSGYIGFKTGSYYGWLKLKVNFSGNLPAGVSLIDNGDGIFGAFDKASDIATDNFKVGSVAPAPVPEPSSAAIGGLGLLALGAMGVREMRRRKRDEVKMADGR